MQFPKILDLPSKFIVYDYETTGLDRQKCAITQIGVAECNIRGEKINEANIFVKPSKFKVPNLTALCITGIDPFATEGKVHIWSEQALANSLFKTFTKDRDTCILGYNSLGFDDTVSQFLFYRNFINPYEWQYINGNSRFDLLKIVKAAHNLAPNLLKIPISEDNGFSYKLEHIAEANGFSHENAHDALSDVHACVNLLGAFLVQSSATGFKNPTNVLRYILSFRNKNFIKDYLRYIASTKDSELVFLGELTNNRHQGAIVGYCLNIENLNVNTDSLVYIDLGVKDITPLINFIKSKENISVTDLQEYFAEINNYNQEIQHQADKNIENNIEKQEPRPYIVGSIKKNKQPILVNNKAWIHNEYITENSELITANKAQVESLTIEQRRSFFTAIVADQAERLQNMQDGLDIKNRLKKYPDITLYDYYQFGHDSHPGIRKAYLSRDYANPQYPKSLENCNHDTIAKLYTELLTQYIGENDYNFLNTQQQEQWLEFSKIRKQESLESCIADLNNIYEHYAKNNSLPRRFKEEYQNLDNFNKLLKKIEDHYQVSLPRLNKLEL